MNLAGSQHPDPADLDAIARDPSHPSHGHVSACARCAAALDQFQSFLLEVPVPEGADVPRAQHVMMQSLLAEMGPDRATTAAPWWQRLLGGGMLRPAMGLAVVVVGLGLVVMLQQDSTQPGLVLRGEGGVGTHDSLSLVSPELLDLEVRLRWAGVDGAEGYRVRFYSPSLVEVGQRDVDGPELTISRVDLNGFGHDRLLWRVSALISGDEVQVSRVGTLSLNPR